MTLRSGPWPWPWPEHWSQKALAEQKALTNVYKEFVATHAREELAVTQRKRVDETVRMEAYREGWQACESYRKTALVIDRNRIDRAREAIERLETEAK